jgi:hypothetical protein
MVVPLAGRVAAAVVGGLLVLAALSSVTETLIVSRPVNSLLTRWVDRAVDWAYLKVVGRFADAGRRDQLRATQAAAVLLGQLAAWLLVAYVGFALLLWPFASTGVSSALIDAGSSLFTLGFAVPRGAVPAVIVFLAAATGLVILTLQIAYLPTLYSAFNRRETQVALLNERAGCHAGAPNCAVPGPVPPSRASGPCPAVPARRVPVLQPDRPDDGLRHPRRTWPRRHDQLDVHRVP